MSDFSSQMRFGEWTIQGKVCLVTGASSGIGRETALALVKRGADRVILACRNMEKGKLSVDYIRKDTGAEDRKLVLRHLDLGNLETIRKFALQIIEEEPELHLLVNNAGVYGPSPRALTQDGFEYNFGINFLGHFFLTNLLLDLLKKSAPSRIVIVASSMHKLCWPAGFHFNDPNYEHTNYEPNLAYAQSKLALVLFTRALSRRLEGTGVTCYCLNPGAANTEVTRYRHWLIRFLGIPIRLAFPSPGQASKTSIYLSTEPRIEQHSGKYFSNCAVADTLWFAKDDGAAEMLWKLGEVLLESKLTKKSETD